jgi:aspartyl-tRNA(Asn)/glutamyl-tRNA(Gln) amidotransferase subunit A
VLTTAEASSNLNRYDGIRYGYQTDHFDTIEELYTNSRSEGFGDEVKRRIMMGTFVLSVGYYDAYFTKAQQVRSLIVKRLEEIFTTNDFLILPTTTDIPWKLGEATKDPVSMYLADIFTVLANLAGLPAISLPMNFTGERIFSSGLQIIGPYGSDQNLLKFANAISGTLVAQ